MSLKVTIMFKNLKVIIPILLVAFFACEKEESTVTDIEIVQSNNSLFIGDTFNLDVSFIPSNLSAPVTWKSDDAQIATVDEKGIVTALSIGSCSVTASIYDNSISSSSLIKVNPIIAKDILLDDLSLTLTIGDVYTLNYSIAPDNTTSKNVTWSSSNESIVQVSSEGDITAVGVGACSITVSVDNSSVSASCDVVVEPIHLNSIELNIPNLEIQVGHSSDLYVIYDPENATDKTVSWVSADASIATVTNEGVIDAIREGTTVVTAISNDGGLEVNCTVSVLPTDYTKADGIFIDQRDNEKYNWVNIGNQIWMADNLRATKYPDGRNIPIVEDRFEWGDLIDNDLDDAYCWYDNDRVAFGDIYGALYTFAVATDKSAALTETNQNTASSIQGVCPDGWHLPSDAEWTALENALTGKNKGSQLAGKKDLWNESYLILDAPSEFGTSGFDAIPAGGRFDTNGRFDEMDGIAYFWSSTQVDDNNVFIRYIMSTKTNVYRITQPKSSGKPVRCIKN